VSEAVRQFEEAFAQWLGVRSAFAFRKGRVALYAILRALGVGEGDEVILPGYTCVVVANPVRYLGATPIYVDIEPTTYNIDPEKIEAKISPRTRLIIAQHTYGYPAEMDAILAVANRHGLPVVEDACLAVGSTYKGRRAGTFGLAAYWSFQWSKAFTTGLGGMVTTDDADLAARIEHLCQEELRKTPAKTARLLAIQRMAHRLLIYPQTTALATALFRWLTLKGVVVGSSDAREFAPEMPPDFFMGMGARTGRAGVRQMRRIEKNLAHRRQMGRLYDRLLREAGWNLPTIPDYMDPVLVRYPVRVADKAAAIAAAAKRFVELGNWFDSPLHQAEVPLHVYNYREGMCPEAEKAVREVVNLPTHRRVNERVAKACVQLICEIGPAWWQDRQGTAIVMPLHGMSVDVEDWYQSTIDPNAELSDRFERSTDKVLRALDSAGIKATFFVLGLAAEKAPRLVRAIADAGHEVQSHGYGHVAVYKLSEDAFRQDVVRAKAVLENIVGTEIFGFRAPFFSIDERTPWAFDVLAETGHRYDSSIFPVKMRWYGIDGYPPEPRIVETPRGQRIVEVPVACFDCLGKRRPVGGGGYFRLWPYWVIRKAFRQLDRLGRPGIVYLHPYEYDPAEMQSYGNAVPLKTRLHQGLGRKGYSVKIDRLLADFDFGPVRDIIAPLLGELEMHSRGGAGQS